MEIQIPFLDTASTQDWLWSGLYLGLAYTAYLTSLVFYRLYLSPVSHIPGPRLAAATFWYEFYYDVIQGGRYPWKIKALHEEYGPIIRINPFEIHINDPDFYEQVYVSSAVRKTNKWPWAARVFLVPGATHTTIPHALHRRRRAMVSSHFSSASIHTLEPLIRAKVNKLISRLHGEAQQQDMLRTAHAYAALAVDIITGYIFAEPWDFLSARDYAPDFITSLTTYSAFGHLNKQFPRLTPLVYGLAQRFEDPLNPVRASLVDYRRSYTMVDEQVEARKTGKDVMLERGESVEMGESVGMEKSVGGKESVGKKQDSVLSAMLDANVPDPEKDPARLAMEANSLVTAATATTVHTLEGITYHVLANPGIQARLTQELAAAKLEAGVSLQEDSIGLPLRTLESLPYLTAVIREGLRVMYGVPQRLPRIAPDAVLEYGEFAIPPGTPVSMSSLCMHENEDIFPEPMVFKPERWLPIDMVGVKLARYLVSFSRGSRQCLGMNLANAELYLAVAALFGGSVQLELYDVEYERDIKIVRDAFDALPCAESKGLRVMVKCCA